MKRNNTLLIGMKGNLMARNKKLALKKERVEVGTIALVALIAT